MVSWSTALKKASIYVGFIIIWAIIGFVIFSIGFVVGGFNVQPGPFDVPIPIMANPLAFLIFFIIGYFIILLGMMATFFKIMAEITAEEVERRLRTSSS
ncbi:MAG: hypothetical protein QXW12_02140 [Nitrososphaerota archaeon]